jgi:hypothetical protein
MSQLPHVISVDRVLQQVDDFFMKTGPVHETLHQLARRLSQERIDYAVIGGMALALHGFVRPTEDVDLLMTGEGLARFRDHLVGRGYVPLFEGARKHFRDAVTGIKVEVLTTGEYPGDGKPKPVAFPDPAKASIQMDEFRVARLETLVELKLASGLSAEHRQLRDLADVQQLIELLHLSLDLAERLEPSVRQEYIRLWELAQQALAPEE